MIIVLDTNVFISAIVKDSTTRRLIVESKQILLFPENIFQEIREHKEEILKKSGLIEEEYNKLIAKILSYVYIVPEELLILQREEAYSLAKNIDLDDVLFFATALVFKDSIIWSDDKKLKNQDKIKVLNTKEIVRLFKKD